MSLPLNRTSPSTRAVGTVSCMRLRQRSSVDLPHPDGPMIAVTSRSRKSTETLRTAGCLPNQAERSTTARSVGGIPEPGPRRQPGRDAEDENECDEDDRSRPGQRVRGLVWADGIVEDLQGERREEERCCLAGDAGDRHQRAGDDAGGGGAEDDGQRGPPARVA